MSEVFHFGLAEYCLPFSAGTPSPLRSPEGKHGRRRELNLRAAVSVPANRSERSFWIGRQPSETEYDAALIGALTEVNFGAFPREQAKASVEQPLAAIFQVEN